MTDPSPRVTDPSLRVTDLLRSVADGQPEAEEELFRVLYAELHARAAHWMGRQRRDHTLQATALVGEAWLRLLAQRKTSWADRGHFLASASKAMRHVLVDHARAKRARKRDAVAAEEPLDSIVVSYEERALDLEALHAALDRLAAFSPSMAQTIQMRFFAGATMDEVSRVLGIPKRTLEREWQAARAWLHAELRER